MCNFAIFPSTVSCERLRHRLRRRVRLQGAMNCSTMRKRLGTSGLSTQNLSRNNKANSRPGREIHSFRRRLKRGTPWRSSTGKTRRYTEARCSQLPCIPRPPRQLSRTHQSPCIQSHSFGQQGVRVRKLRLPASPGHRPSWMCQCLCETSRGRRETKQLRKCHR